MSTHWLYQDKMSKISKLGKIMLHLTLHYSIIIVWNVWRIRRFLVMGNAMWCARLHACNMHYVWAKTIKDWIMDNVKLGLFVGYIMTKHEQHCFEHDPNEGSWTHNHFVLPHDICNAWTCILVWSTNTIRTLCYSIWM
jgi:hypothetical protein